MLAALAPGSSAFRVYSNDTLPAGSEVAKRRVARVKGDLYTTVYVARRTLLHSALC